MGMSKILDHVSFSQIMKTTVNPNMLCNMCIVVPDIEKAAAAWANLLGIEMPEILQTHLQGGSDYQYRGQPVSCDLKVCNIPMNGFVLELHQPVGGDSTFSEFEKRHGYGLHHMSFEVGDKRDAVVDEMTEEGYKMRTIGIYPGSSWTVMDTEETLGVNVSIKPVR